VITPLSLLGTLDGNAVSSWWLDVKACRSDSLCGRIKGDCDTCECHAHLGGKEWSRQTGLCLVALQRPPCETKEIRGGQYIFHCATNLGRTLRKTRVFVPVLGIINAASQKVPSQRSRSDQYPADIFLSH